MKRLVVAALVLLCLPALAACGGSVPPDLPVESGGNEANIIFEPSALEPVLRQMNLEEKVAQMLMASCHEKGSAQRAAAAILAAVEEKIIPSEQIDASVLRILRWKSSLGHDISRE